MSIELIRALEQGSVIDERSIQDWEIETGKAFVRKYLCA